MTTTQHPPMRFTLLQPDFMRLTDPNGKSWAVVESIDAAQGVQFLCPLCYHRNGGSIGTHRVMCWSRSRGVPDHVTPLPGRWKLEGSGFSDLTLNGDPPPPKPGEPVKNNARSVWLTGPGCGWHGWVTGGLVTSVKVDP